MLGKLGFEVDFATDGETALERLGAARYDVLFLDCDLPGMSGYDVARRVRSGPTEGDGIFIVATTAHSTVADQGKCFASGMEAFLAKPITPVKLQGTLAAPGFPRASAPELAEPGVSLKLIREIAEGSAQGLDCMSSRASPRLARQRRAGGRIRLQQGVPGRRLLGGAPGGRARSDGRRRRARANRERPAGIRRGLFRGRARRGALGPSAQVRLAPGCA